MNLPNQRPQRHECTIDWTPDTRCQDSSYLLSREKPFKDLSKDEILLIMNMDSLCKVDSAKASWVSV